MRDYSAMSLRRLINLLRRTADPAEQAKIASAFTQRLTRYVQICVRTGFSQLEAEIENIVDELFSKLWEKEQTFRGNSVAYHKMMRDTIFWHCTDILKAERAFQSLDVLGPKDEDELFAEEFIDLEKSATSFGEARRTQPEDHLSDLLMGKTIRQTLDQMTAADREVLILYHIALKSYQEIARIVGKKESAVRARASRARHTFNELYLRQLAQGRNRSEEEIIIDMIARLPAEKRAVVLAWWGGARTVSALNRQTEQSLSQRDMKLLLGQGLWVLCELLMDLF